MAVYVDLCNLIIDKRAITEKYDGGLAQFRVDYNIPTSEVNQEDDELFLLAKMNADEFDLNALIAKGLHFDNDKYQSNDFSILPRYSGFLWETDWVQHNGVFAWHINTSQEVLAKVNEISNLTVDFILEEIEKGNILLKTIRIEE
jgi:hypothetical protein